MSQRQCMYCKSLVGSFKATGRHPATFSQKSIPVRLWQYAGKETRRRFLMDINDGEASLR